MSLQSEDDLVLNRKIRQWKYFHAEYVDCENLQRVYRATLFRASTLLEKNVKKKSTPQTKPEPEVEKNVAEDPKEKKLLTSPIYQRTNLSYPDQKFTNENSFKIIKNNNLVWSLEGPNQEILVGNFVKTEFLNVKLIKLLPKQKTHVFEFKKNTSYLSLNDNIKVNIFKNKEEYALSRKDGLYLPASTQFFLENTNNYNAEIIFCEGL